MKDEQKNIYYVIGVNLDAIANAPFLAKLKKKGYEVIFMTDAIDEYMIQQLKEYEGKKLINKIWCKAKNKDKNGKSNFSLKPDLNKFSESKTLSDLFKKKD